MLDKVTINKFFVAFIPEVKTGRKCEVKYWRIIRAILYKLKTGCQWSWLPMKELFGR